MRNPEAREELHRADDLGLDLGDFDINQAFQSAMSDVATNKDTDLDEKIRRMEVIISEGTSELYSDFVDFRAMANQMQMMCNHDHNLQSMMNSSESLSGFMGEHSDHDGHNHGNDEYETDPKTGKKTKKKKKKFGHRH